MKNSAHAEDSSSSGGRQRVALVEEDSSLCLGGGCYTSSLYFPETGQTKRDRGQEWKINFVEKDLIHFWWIRGQHKTPLWDYVCSWLGWLPSHYPEDFMWFILQKRLLRCHFAAQDNANDTSWSFGFSLCLDVSVFSDFTLPAFHSRTSRKKYSTCHLENILGIIVLFPSVHQILLVHGIVPFIQQLVLINTKLFWNPEKLYHKLCLVCI